MKQKFKALLKKHPSLDAAFIEVPFDVEKVFGAKRVKVKASFDGVLYRGLLVNMGGCHMIGVTRALRKQIGKHPGDIINVEIEKDTEERTIQTPEDLKKALAKASLTDIFDQMSYTHRKEYVQWITEAKKEETRKSRILKAVEMIKELKKKKKLK
jgi:hypothetical protein